MNLALWLERTAQVKGDQPAVFRGAEQIMTYAAFFRAAQGLAAGLAARGVGPGDRVALFMKNCPEYLLGFYGVWGLGAAVVPINAKLHPKEAAYIIKNSGAKLVLVTDDLASDLSDIIDVPMIHVEQDEFAALCEHDPVAVAPRADIDLAWLFYTSGTTGQPKGVYISHGMIRSTSMSYLLDCDDVSADDAVFYMAPMSHGAGIYAPIHVARGARHITPASGGFDEVELLDTAEAQGPLQMFMAPTMVRRFTDIAKAAGRRGDGIKTIVYGGGPMYLADIEEAVDWFGPRFVQIYGQGECPMAITVLSREDVADRTHPRWRERLASVGRAQSVVEVRIGDEDGQPVPHGVVGEIMVRGTPVMPGYWNNPDATQKTLVDGWLMTGDMGFLDEDGYLTMRDRSKDVIISGGTNIYPREVEEALLIHPDVREVSVVGRPSAEWGEDVVAFVVLANGRKLDEANLDAHCLDNIARFKRPKAYFAVPELPKNNYGKVLKTQLRKTLA
ncbi:long-chain acyl-CoA synthetase [Aliiroseovarius halocynthiae]|uniref:3-methylmercaptopropionyl-CoA ligase n=1 Tax=Aliiroseovarius halocynthiae TaxID=985055 RepID=A0A545SM19_9RHOB|nr:AMP-binding protein [Aliiroseovarius halocynthiae]TQV66019.1 long-chain fatty acid--CoA ligase [Aliiroseovarius halocynthiae]SMR83277.1 long-chain acyl-CoA synthetase [Aliiroseovarius halocynthiae]